MAHALIEDIFSERNTHFERSLRNDVFNDVRTSMMQNRSESGGEWWARFQALLDDQVDWPSEYLFKFIVPSEQLGELKEVFEGHPVRVRASSKGNYMSVTARLHMESSEAVLAVYQAAGRIQGVISL